MERGKKHWKGPLADAMEGVPKERIAAEWGTTCNTVDAYMGDEGKQGCIGIDYLAGLHRLASQRGKARIEKFVRDRLVA